MDISIFEVIGPIMMGPSSSNTAGMARLGAVAHQFIDEEIKSIDLKFCPQQAEDYYTFMTHLGLIGGVLGINERDVRLRKALDLAAEKGIRLSYSVFDEPIPTDSHTVKITAELASGRKFELTGVSIGGGSIKLLDIDGFAVDLAQTAAHLFVWGDADVSSVIASRLHGANIHVSESAGKFLCYCEVDKSGPGCLPGLFDDVPEITKTLFVAPFLPFERIPNEPLFKTFDEFMALSESTGKNAAELAVDYEINSTPTGSEGKGSFQGHSSSA